MAERRLELDEDRMETEGQRALHEAEERAERAEAELARLRRSQGLHDAVLGQEHAGAAPKKNHAPDHAEQRASRREHARDAEGGERRKHADPTGAERDAANHAAGHGAERDAAAGNADRAAASAGHGHGHSHRHASELEGDLFAGQDATAEAKESSPKPKRSQPTHQSEDDETPARHAQRMVGKTIEEDRHGHGHDGEEHRRHERAQEEHSRHGRTQEERDPGNASEVKDPPTRSSAEGEPEMDGGEEELRKDSMMAHLLDSLDAGKDIGHYGRLVFAMVSRHFLPHEEVLAWMTKDRDFGEEDAELMLRQVEGRDYSPPRRAKILEYQREQEFPILPHPHDPDCGNLYRNLKFPDAVYKHIGHYQEQKMEAEDE